MSSRIRVRAPELQGEVGWINTGGAELSLANLRGKIVILDFWTFCCINCLHVLDELRDLEQKYADVLVIVGVHSPKFVHEADRTALLAAVDRYSVDHPVINDPKLATWQQYGVRAWPTLVVIDPEGYVVAQHSGEGHAHALDVLIAELIAEHAERGTLRRGDSPFVPRPPQPGVLRFPSKAIATPDGWLMADAGSNRVLEVDASGELLKRASGTGQRGSADGLLAEFSEPNGLCRLPAEIAGQVGYDIVVADTVNHLLRGLSLESGEVRTLAGVGRQWMQGDGPTGQAVPALGIPLSSPWDVVWWEAIGEVVIAMAGIHQLWSFNPLDASIRVLAGTTNEGLVDGLATEAWFAQTSGLAVVASDLWFVDSETSSLRRMTADGQVTTAVGAGLFDFGFVDGAAREARFQHPLGLCGLPDGSIAVADTYNGAVRRFDPTWNSVSTIATELAEPSDVKWDAKRGELVVVESAAHRLTRIVLPAEARQVVGDALRTQRPVLDVKSGGCKLRVVFVPPAGQKLDDRYGPSTQLIVSASPAELLVSGAGTYQALELEIELSDQVAAGVLHVAARAASCDADGAEFPACHVHQQDWGVPVRVTESGASEIKLMLAGLD